MPHTSAIRSGGSGYHAFMQRLARGLLPLIGWRIEGALPDCPKFILILYPHTSNWDLVIGLICAYALGLLRGWPYGYMAKDTALRWPVLGPLLHRLGAIGINRRAPQGAVEQMAAVFAQHERLMLAITPEGTRRHAGYWKSGFYHIARQAGVPVLLAYLDYARHAGGLGPLISLSGDVEADLERIRQFYAGVTAKFPHQAGTIRFKPSDS